MVHFAAVLVAILAASPTGALRTGISLDYEAFRQEVGTARVENAEGYLARVALFEQRRDEVARHNARAGIRWRMAVNKFADFTQEEFQALLGHRPLRHHVPSRSSGASSINSLLELKPSMPLAATVDWSLKLNRTTLAKNQGGCGSCWAVATAGALETHAEALGHSVPEVSYEQLVDCVENLHECGGTGGCKGATSELAFAYVKEHGLVKRSDYAGYQSGGDGKCHPTATPVLTTTGFVRLEENKVQPLLEAVTHGPVAVSADASAWSGYGDGVFDDCDKDAIINHAILLMGYGQDVTTKTDYWLIRNSWGGNWGEQGYIRLLRHQGSDEYCGTDTKPMEGVGCKGGPATMPVCGMCGVLSDSAYPTGVALKV